MRKILSKYVWHLMVLILLIRNDKFWKGRVDDARDGTYGKMKDTSVQFMFIYKAARYKLRSSTCTFQLKQKSAKQKSWIRFIRSTLGQSGSYHASRSWRCIFVTFVFFITSRFLNGLEETDMNEFCTFWSSFNFGKNEREAVKNS